MQLAVSYLKLLANQWCDMEDLGKEPRTELQTAVIKTSLSYLARWFKMLLLSGEHSSDTGVAFPASLTASSSLLPGKSV